MLEISSGEINMNSLLTAKIFHKTLSNKEQPMEYCSSISFFLIHLQNSKPT